MTRGRDDHVIADRLEMIDRLTVDFGIRDDARKIVLRVVPAPLHERHEIGLELAEQPKQFLRVPRGVALRALAVAEVGILAREQIPASASASFSRPIAGRRGSA